MMLFLSVLHFSRLCLFDHAFIPAFYHEYILTALYHSVPFNSTNTLLGFSCREMTRVGSLAFIPRKARRGPKQVALAECVLKLLVSGS